MSADAKLKELGLTLPSIPTPVANYVPWKRDGNTIYLSGQGPRHTDGVGRQAPTPGSTKLDPARGWHGSPICEMRP